ELALGGSRRQPGQGKAFDEHALVHVRRARAPRRASQTDARRSARVRARGRGRRGHAGFSANAQGRAVEGRPFEDREASTQMSEISLQGLVKSFKGPHGPIEAVRGVDVEI